MIVRIMGEGQFRLPDDAASRLNELDAQLDADIRDDGAADLERHLRAMHDLVRDRGAAVAFEELAPSDVILPPTTISLAQLKSLLGEDGLVPG